MWIIQIIVGTFWLVLGTMLLFREYVAWTLVENIEWFKKRYHSSSSRQWERFCRDFGLVSYVVGCLLFFTLPFGMGVIGVIIIAPIVLMLRA